MQRFDAPVGIIHVEGHEAFAIALRSNPTTGYTWHARVDPCHVELVSREFEAASEAIGAGGREVFTFRPHGPTETTIDFEYRRPWDKEIREQERVQVIVSRGTPDTSVGL